MARTISEDGPFRDDENFIANKCSLCGSTDADGYVTAEGYVICSDCAEQMDLQDVMDLMGYETVTELLEALASNEI